MCTWLAAHFINYFIVACGLIIVWKIWRLYTLISSPAFLILIFAFGYLTMYRVALPKYPQLSTYGVIVPFYLLAIGAFHILFKAIYSSIYPQIQPKSLRYSRQKPEWLTVGNVCIWVFMIIVASIVIYLELDERWSH